MGSNLQFHSNFKKYFLLSKVQNLVCDVWSGSALFPNVIEMADILIRVKSI